MSIDKASHRKFTGSLHGIFLFLFPDCGMIPSDLFCIMQKIGGTLL